MLSEVHRVLKPEGIFYLMTDVPEVDEFQQEVLKSSGLFDFNYVDDNNWDLNTKTNQEEFCIDKKIPFIRMICRKK